MIAGNGHFSEAKSRDIQVIVCIFPLKNKFVRTSGCTHQDLLKQNLSVTKRYFSKSNA